MDLSAPYGASPDAESVLNRSSAFVMVSQRSGIVAQAYSVVFVAGLLFGSDVVCFGDDEGSKLPWRTRVRTDHKNSHMQIQPKTDT